MTITATYNSDISRVQLAFSGYSTLADYAKVERLDPNGVTWSVIRGGDQVALTSGAGAVDDFEFVPNTVNTYRVSAIDSAAPAWIGSSGPFSAVNTNLSPLYNGSTITGDLILMLASIRSTSATVNTPSGWTMLVNGGNMCLLGKYQDGAATPTLTFTGGAAGDDVIAQTTTFRNTSITPVSQTSVQSNGSAQNIAYPTISGGATGVQAVLFGWKQDDWTTAPVPSGWDNEVGNVPVTAGNDAGQLWEQRALTLGQTMPSGSWTLTGGAAAISKAAAVVFGIKAFTNQETATVTPTFAFDEYWLKNPSRPGLNIKVQVTEIGDITRPARTGTFPVLGRTVPVAVTDVQGSRQFSLEIFTDGESNATDMDNRLSTGEPMLLQGGGPTDLVPTVYFVAGDIVNNRPAKGHTAHTFTIPVTEVARPGNTVYGLTYVWQDVINNYADWNAVLAATPDWSSLINKVSNTVVIVS